MNELIDEKLAKLARNYPALWDKSCQLFKNKIKKENSIKELAAILNTHPEIVISRFKFLREKYRKEKAKLVAKSGSGQSHYEPWHLMESLRFLDSVQIPRKKTESRFLNVPGQLLECDSDCVTLSEKEQFLSSSSNENTIWIPEIDEEDQAENKLLEKEVRPLMDITSPLPKRRKLKDNNQIMENLINKISLATDATTKALKRQQKDEHEQDYVDAFGTFVVGNLRRLDESDRDDAILEITKLLTEKVKKKITCW